MGTSDGWGSRNAGMPTPPRQHILNMTKSQHSIGESQSHIPSHCPGNNFRFCFFSLARGAFVHYQGLPGYRDFLVKPQGDSTPENMKIGLWAKQFMTDSVDKCPRVSISIVCLYF